MVIVQNSRSHEHVVVVGSVPRDLLLSHPPRLEEPASSTTTLLVASDVTVVSTVAKLLEYSVGGDLLPSSRERSPDAI